MNSADSKKKGLLAITRSIMRVKRLSYITEKSYHGWIKRFAKFYPKTPPREYSSEDVIRYLSYLAEHRRVAASTQNQALNSSAFLFNHVLKKDLGEINQFTRAKKIRYLPTVLSVEEVTLILKTLNGTQKLIASLLYGTGMRLIEALRLRILDVDFDRNMIAEKGVGTKSPLDRISNALKNR